MSKNVAASTTTTTVKKYKKKKKKSANTVTALDPVKIITYAVDSLRLLDRGKGVSESAIVRDACAVYCEGHPNARKSAVRRAVSEALIFMLAVKVAVRVNITSGVRMYYRLNGAAFLDDSDNAQGLESVR